ncbi:MAG: hypothetical protein M3Z14_07125 [Candidatus Eremiobacteraeota bacterium]|nr:hypothetical protein [Candidatus Eremiobacteraeota bacterium]
MVQLNFELPSPLATTLQNEANNQQHRMDEIVELALLNHFNPDPGTEKNGPSPDFDLAPQLIAKMNAIAGKAAIDVDAIVRIAVQQYFSQARTAAESLPFILHRLTGICEKPSNA